MTAYVSRSIGLHQAARAVQYMRDAGVPMRVVGNGTLLLGVPSHLVMLTELAEHEQKRKQDRDG
jgi:hypothetical protein